MQQSLAFINQGATLAGVDEAGRGPLAGPVVAAAVILDADHPIKGLKDSKLLSETRRASLAKLIRQHAKTFAVALAEPINSPSRTTRKSLPNADTVYFYGWYRIKSR